MLAQAGFTVHRTTFAEPGTAPVENLYARIGGEEPNLMFAGHTDVVPPGDEAAWRASAVCRRGRGRQALRPRRRRHEGRHRLLRRRGARLSRRERRPAEAGSISLLITGDEESVAVNGTIKLLRWAAERGEKFDHCILGEPSNVEVLGDTIKAGRRGSLNGTLIVNGRQGHVAYPDRADNPIRGLVTLIAALQAPLDDGSAHFDPSHLEFTSVDVGNPTVNLIPGEARARFNIRYNDCHSQTALKTLIEHRAQTPPRPAACITRSTGSRRTPTCFVTKPGPFTDLAAAAIAEVTGRKPKLSTSGGTSDARFIKDYCPVLEFGLVGQTMHAVDECAPVADLVDADGDLPAHHRALFRLMRTPPAPDKAPAAARPGRSAVRSRAASAAARSSALHLPSPTCTSEPTIERT